MSYRSGKHLTVRAYDMRALRNNVILVRSFVRDNVWQRSLVSLDLDS